MDIETYEHIKELAPFTIEFIGDDDNYRQLESYVKAVYDDYILISPPEKNGVSYNVPDDAEVNITFPHGEGVVVHNCLVIGKELGTISGVKLSFPYTSKVVQRREYLRVPAKLKIEITCYQDQTYANKKSFFAITKNISGSGAAFYHKEPIGNYYDIGCKIYLNDDDPKPVVTKNDLVYSKEVEIKNEKYYLSAVTYTSISEADSARIIKECFKYQVRQKRIKDS